MHEVAHRATHMELHRSNTRFLDSCVYTWAISRAWAIWLGLAAGHISTVAVSYLDRGCVISRLSTWPYLDSATGWPDLLFFVYLSGPLLIVKGSAMANPWRSRAALCRPDHRGSHGSRRRRRWSVAHGISLRFVIHAARGSTTHSMRSVLDGAKVVIAAAQLHMVEGSKGSGGTRKLGFSSS